MTADPRVEAVAVAWDLDTDLDTFDDPVWPRRLAAVAVAALDAYDAPKFSSVVHECCERPTEVDLRERIAQEIESKCRYMNHENRRLCQRCTAAARIARGQS